MTLTAKQERFVQEYLVDLNATQAAIRAGYSEKSAYQTAFETLKKPEIQDAIAAAQKARAERTEVTQDDVIRGLLNEAEFTGDGASHSARVTAWAHLGKHLGMFPNKHEMSGPNGGPIETSDVSDIELARRIAFLLTQPGQKTRAID